MPCKGAGCCGSSGKGRLQMEPDFKQARKPARAWAAKGAPARPDTGTSAFCSFFRSKSKPPKTPPSHGLTGFAAIKSIAKPAMPRNGAGGCGESHEKSCKKPLAAGWKAGSLFTLCPQRATHARPGTGSDAFRSFFRSKSKPPKTPPSHGLTGFAAIKPIAKNHGFQTSEMVRAATQPDRPCPIAPCRAAWGRGRLHRV